MLRFGGGHILVQHTHACKAGLPGMLFNEGGSLMRVGGRIRVRDSVSVRACVIGRVWILVWGWVRVRVSGGMTCTELGFLFQTWIQDPNRTPTLTWTQTLPHPGTNRRVVGSMDKLVRVY